MTSVTGAPPPLAAGRRAEYPTDDGLLARVLQVYKPDCRYLRDAVLRPDDAGRAVVECTFGIPAPFYIDDTGHFNAVEFNLCYNQMLYYAVAKCVREGLMPPFDRWTMTDFWRRQLPDCYIADFHSTFAKAMRSHHFHGELAFRHLRHSAGGANWPPMIVADTTCRYWDDHGGHCKGEVRMVFLDPPHPPHPPEPAGAEGGGARVR